MKEARGGRSGRADRWRRPCLLFWMPRLFFGSLKNTCSCCVNATVVHIEKMHRRHCFTRWWRHAVSIMSHDCINPVCISREILRKVEIFYCILLEHQKLCTRTKFRPKRAKSHSTESKMLFGQNTRSSQRTAWMMPSDTAKWAKFFFKMLVIVRSIRCAISPEDPISILGN